MTTVTAQKRDGSVKAKKLRREGFVPGIICGHGIKEKLMIQIPEKDAMKLIKDNQRGERVALLLDGETKQVIIKDYTYNALTKQLEVLDFQALVKGEKIHTEVEIVLKNESMAIDGVVTQELSVVHYKAAPEDLLDTIVIDFETLPAVKSMKVKDLKEFQNPNISVSNPDALIFSVIYPAKMTEEEETEETTEE